MNTFERNSMKIELTNSAKDKKKIEELMLSYNQNAIGKIDVEPFMFTLKDESNNIVGGIFGDIIPEWMFINTFITAEDARHKGNGQKMFDLAEELAKKNNCKKIMLRTNEYHSYNFYKKNGFKVNSVVEDLPSGYREYTMVKELI